MAHPSLKKIPPNSNGLYLRFWELLVVLAVVLLIAWVALPLWHKSHLKVSLEKDFRFSYAMRDDYLLYEATVREACKTYDTLFLGDSVIWGMYVRNDSTLTACLNRRLGRDVAVNLAVDGLHPVAMEGLLKNYGGAIRNKRVYLYFNPLWMTTSLYDLTGEGESTINHPRLLPQFDRSIQCYHGTLKERCNATLEKHLPFYALLHHFRVCFFDNRDFKNYIVENPRENPISHVRMELSPIETGHTGNYAIDWWEGGILEQDWPWVDVKSSRQCRAFLNCAELLRKQDNQVVILLGTVNPHMQLPESLQRYHALMKELEETFQGRQFRVVALPELPSDEYGDASHPLVFGYKRLADFLADNENFEK